MLDTMLACEKDILEQPCIVGLDSKKIWFKDFGEGCSLEKMNKIISKYGASTRDKDSRMIGVMGLGCKSGFAVSSQFSWESNYQGVKRHWLFSNAGTDFEITLLSEEETEEENGTTVIIPIKEDVHEWIDAIHETLPYYKGIIVESEFVSKDFNTNKLIEGNTFLYKEGYSSNDLHIVLDQVIYKINAYDIDVPIYNFPFGIKVGLHEGLQPTPSKDAIIITDKVKKLLREKVKDVLTEIKSFVEKKECNLLQYFTQSNNHYKFKFDDVSISLNKNELNKFYTKLEVELPDTDFQPVSPDFKLIKHPPQNLLFSFFREVSRLDYGKFTERYKGYEVTNSDFILLDIPLNNSKIDFFKTKFNNVRFIKFERKSKLYDGNYNYYRHLGLKHIKKDKWRDVIKAWQAEEDKIIEQSNKVSNYIKEYEEWMKNRPKKTNSKALGKKKDGEITVKFPTSLDRGSEFNCKFEPKIIPVSLLTNNKLHGNKFYVYSSEREEVDKIWFIHLNRSSIIPVLLNKTETVKVQELDNFMHYKDFAKGKSRLSHKYITALMIFEDIQKEEYLKELLVDTGYYSLKYKQPQLLAYNKTLSSKKWKNIVEYLKKWKVNKQEDKLFESLIETYVKLEMIDKPIWQEWLSLKEDLKYLSFSTYVRRSDETKKVIDHLYIMQRQNKFLKNKINKLNKLNKV